MAEETFTEFARKTLLRADMLKRAVAIKTFSAIIRDSPVGDPDLWKVNAGKPLGKRKGPAGYVGGRFRANWNCTIAAPNLSTTEETNYSGAIPAVIQVCEASDRKDINWLANSLPYAARLENGWSKQAPAGMVRRNVTRIKRLISQELQKVKAQT